MSISAAVDEGLCPKEGSRLITYERIGKLPGFGSMAFADLREKDQSVVFVGDETV